MELNKYSHYEYYKSSFFENRLIYVEKPSTLETLGEGAGELFSAAADLLKLMTSVLKDGVNLVRKGYRYMEHGVVKLSESVSDPGKPSQLPEYDELKKYFTLRKSRNADVNKVLKLHTCLVFLEFKSHQLNQFYRPAVAEFSKVERRLNTIKRQKYLTKARREELKDLIEKGENAIDKGVFIKGSNWELDLKMKIRGYKSELESLNASISTVISWAKPEQIMTEFPPGSGKYIERFVPNKNNKVKVDLNKLYSFLKSYLNKYDPDKYLEEMKKLAFHRDRLIAKVIPDKYHSKVTKWMRSITSTGENHKNSFPIDSFETKEGGKSLNYLTEKEDISKKPSFNEKEFENHKKELLNLLSNAPKRGSEEEEEKKEESREEKLLKILKNAP